jgi:hypothetical protein
MEQEAKGAAKIKTWDVCVKRYLTSEIKALISFTNCSQAGTYMEITTQLQMLNIVMNRLLRCHQRPPKAAAWWVSFGRWPCWKNLKVHCDCPLSIIITQCWHISPEVIVKGFKNCSVCCTMVGCDDMTLKSLGMLALCGREWHWLKKGTTNSEGGVTLIGNDRCNLIGFVY